MPRYVALLRGISPMNPTHKMPLLRALFEDLGFTNVSSVISSGNVIFDSPKRSKQFLEGTIERALHKHTGTETPTMIRTKDEIAALIADQPFKGKRLSKTRRANVTFLKDGAQPSFSLPHRCTGSVILSMVDHALCSIIDLAHTTTPDVMLVMDKEFGRDNTTRTWETVEKIWKKLQEVDND